MKEKSNLRILNNILESIPKKIDHSSYETIRKSIDDLTYKIMIQWKDPLLIGISPSDQIHYIRDLLYLKA